jgi:5-methylcytosine-specific restriction endonuclease McrA
VNPYWPPGWPKLRAAVLERDGRRCQLEYAGCRGEATTADHIVPRRFGGRDTLANLRAACGPCNSRRGDGTKPVAKAVSAW